MSNQLVDLIDQLKAEWGIRARGAVVERLLEDLFTILSLQLMRALMLTHSGDFNNDDLPDETTSLVLISRSEVLTDDVLPPLQQLIYLSTI